MNHALDVNVLSTPSASEYTDYSDIIEGSISLGSVVSMGGYQWLVCHVDYDNKRFFMIDAVVEQLTAFGSTLNYAGSTIAALAKTFENNLPYNVTNKLLSIDTYGVIAKVFIPTLNQYGLTPSNTDIDNINTFTYFYRSTDNRIGYLNNEAVYVWTSTVYGNYVCNISNTGSRSSHNPDQLFGFRPCVALPL